MRRVLVKLVVLLVLASAVNLVGAWALACGPGPFVGMSTNETWNHPEHGLTRAWVGGSRHAAAVRLLRGKYDPSIGDQGDRDTLLAALPEWPWLVDAVEQPLHVYLSSGPVPDFSRAGSAAVGAGFPWPCLWFEYTGSFGVRSLRFGGGVPLDPVLNQPDVAGGLKTPPRYDDFVDAVIPPTLPLRPMWRGMVLNTLLYAAALALVWFALTLPWRLIPGVRSRAERLLVIAPGRPESSLRGHGQRGVVCLVFGLVVSVLSAWLLAAAAPSFLLMPRLVALSGAGSDPGPLALVNQSSGFGVDQVAFTDARGQAWLHGKMEVERRPDDLPAWTPWPAVAALESDETLLCYAAGWPARSLRCRCLGSDARWLPVAASGAATPPVPVRPPEWQQGIVLAQTPNGGPFSARVLPLRPIPSGLIVNALTAGGLLYLALTTYALGTVTLRRVRGRCPGCGYDLCHEAALGCSECGWRR